jgi:hypothetical protein
MIFGIVVICVIIGIIGFYVYRTWFYVPKSTINSDGVDVSQHRGQIFDHTMVNAIHRSKYFPDDLYIGRMAKLDPSLKVMFKNVLFGFPIDPLIVNKFLYFDIDGNPFEEVQFDKIGVKDYILLYDTTEKVIYFLNKLMTIGIPEGEQPAMVTDDVIVLEEAGEKYTYNDFSGLIKVRVTSAGDSAFDRLIRVYQREITPDDNEYCIMMMNTPGVVSIYIGFNIGIIQLEII